MPLSNLAIVAIVVDVSLVVVAGVGLFVLYRRQRAAVSPSDWRADSAALARDLHELLSDREPPHDAESVSRAVTPMAGRFERLAREAPSEVDHELASRTYRLGVACRRLGVENRAFSENAGSYDALLSEVRGRAAELAEDVESSGAVRD